MTHQDHFSQDQGKCSRWLSVDSIHVISIISTFWDGEWSLKVVSDIQLKFYQSLSWYSKLYWSLKCHESMFGHRDTKEIFFFYFQRVRIHHFFRSIERRQSPSARITWARWKKGTRKVIKTCPRYLHWHSCSREWSESGHTHNFMTAIIVSLNKYSVGSIRLMSYVF